MLDKGRDSGAVTVVRSPDELNKAIQVTSPGAWMVLAACFALLAGILAWAFFGTVSTGKSANRVMEAVNYYGGRLSVVSAVFSAMDSVNGIPVLSVFGKKDLPDYQCSDYHDCPLCRAGQPIDGLVNAFGISIL